MLKPSLQLRLGQQLTMTPQLQQAIRLLQMPALELQAHIRELLESNVMLEPVEDTEATGVLEAVEPPAPPEPPARKAESTVEVVEDGWNEQSVGASETPWSQSDDDDRQQEFADETEQSLQDHLLWQLELAKLEPRDLAIARAIVDAISEDGYLTESLEEIANTLKPEVECEPAEVEPVLALVQSLDPPGVGARSVGECIELQLRQLDPETPGLLLAMQIAQQHLELRRRPRAVPAAARAACHRRRAGRGAGAGALLPSAARRASISAGAAEYVIPDVFVRRTEHGWAVEINSATLPRVRLNQGYASLIGRNASHATHARPASGGALAAQEPRDPQRDADEGGALHRRTAGRIPRAGR